MQPVVALAVAILSVSGADGEVSLRARLEPPVTPFHRPAVLTVTVESPAGVEAALPSLPEKLEGLEIKAGAVTTALTANQRRRVEQHYTLDPTGPGLFLVPTLKSTWGDGQEAIAPPLILQARELTEAELASVQTFQDIVLPSAILGEQRTVPWGTIAALGGVLAVAGALAGLVLWKKGKPLEAAPPPAAWETALRRLRELQQRKLAELGKHEQYYVDLSAILRFYIEDRFHVHAPEQTTQEFLEAAATSGSFSDTHQRLLAIFLRHADRVKFARLEPTHEDMHENFEVVRQFVEETVPRVEVMSGEAAA
ncbi:MAG: hypothetical protein HYV26_24040 [Candidatus Hydrogenedentes bacterium]|nr:hypothetical protein [Candidatus Hydrogenedentota bacterium]